MSEINSNLSEIIAENFGANASYVEGLLLRFRADRRSVDDSWQEYFDELLTGKNGSAAAEPAAAVTATPAAEKKPAAPAQAAVSDEHAKALIGPAKKIVENMEASLSVPTATSLRTIPVKLLEENRTIINS